MDPDLKSLAEQWLHLDRDPITHATITALLRANATPALDALLRPRIAFGTAGLRAAMAPGFARMNRLTVIQATQGLASHMLQHVPGAARRGVVVGHDARHHSATFARLVVAVLRGRGIAVFWLGRCHTPLVPFCVAGRGAAGGIVVTASHNPKGDNGYKVYWANGCQIIPPHDRGIAAEIERNLVPDEGAWDVDAVERGGEGVWRVGAEVAGEYVQRVVGAVRWRRETAEGARAFTYTPMHGVGLEVFTKVMEAMGIAGQMHVVASQAQPDPDFPTVKFPNPEEKGALDEAMRTAAEHGDMMILANDPDADRFAAAELVDGRWRQFTGNQLGVLLASFVLEELVTESDRRPAMLASTVSSRMLARMAAKTKAFRFEETLTGFKWLGNRAQQLVKEGCAALYAYEEAIGYMLSEVVYDKDGVAAAALFIHAMQKWSAKGLTPWSKLQALHDEFGHFEEANTYLVSPSPAVTNSVFKTIRVMSPKSVGSREILRWRDLTEGFDTATSDNVPLLPVDKSAQMITCELQGGVAFTVRGSGTEPKIKFYIEAVGNTAVAAKEAAQAVLQDLLAEWFKPEENGLRLAGTD